MKCSCPPLLFPHITRVSAWPEQHRSMCPRRNPKGSSRMWQESNPSSHPRTRMIVLNTPCNPTGVVYPRSALEAIADLAKEHDLLIVADEIYEKMIYDGAEHISIAALPGMKERTLTMNGFSKSYSMTGWRLGYVAAPRRDDRRHAAHSPICHRMPDVVCPVGGPWLHSTARRMNSTTWLRSFPGGGASFTKRSSTCPAYPQWNRAAPSTSW